MRANPKGVSPSIATAKPLRIILQPGQVVIIQVAEASGTVPALQTAELLAGISPAGDSSVSPAGSPDSPVSPPGSRDLAGRL
jgi:hypothetical protein